MTKSHKQLYEIEIHMMIYFIIGLVVFNFIYISIYTNNVKTMKCEKNNNIL